MLVHQSSRHNLICNLTPISNGALSLQATVSYVKLDIWPGHQLMDLTGRKWSCIIMLCSRIKSCTTMCVCACACMLAFSGGRVTAACFWVLLSHVLIQLHCNSPIYRWLIFQWPWMAEGLKNGLFHNLFIFWMKGSPEVFIQQICSPSPSPTGGTSNFAFSSITHVRATV